MKKRIVLILLLISVLLMGGSVFAVTGLAAAENTSRLVLTSGDTTLATTLINNNTEISYLHIQNITAFCGEDGLYFSDGQSLYQNSRQISGAADAVTFYQGHMLTADSSGIYYKTSSLLSGEFSGITVLGETLFASGGNKIIAYSIDYNAPADTFTLAQTETFTYTDTVQDLCASSQAVFFKLKNSSWIFTISAGLKDNEIESVTNLKRIAANPQLDSFFCLTRDSVLSCKADGDGMLNKKDLKISHGGAERIAADTNKIYLSDYDEGAYGRVYRIRTANHNTSDLSGFIAGRCDADYFYSSPSGVSSRFGGIYVADTDNNRITRLSDKGVVQITDYKDGDTQKYFDEPKSAALSLSGDLYVAYNKNKVTNMTTGKTAELKDPDGRSLVIEKMLLDSNGNVYVLGVHNLTKDTFAYSADPALNKFSLLSFDSPTAIGYKAGGDVLFYDGSIKNLKGEIIAQSEPLKDFCVDFSGKVFGINIAGNLISINGGASQNHGGDYDKIALSNVSNSFCGYGDLLLVETKTNSLKKINAADAGVADISTHYTVPDVAGDHSAHIKTNNAVASVKYDTPLFSQPTEAGINYTAAKDSDVFIRYDVDTPEDMYFVVSEDMESQSLKWGYIYRSALNTPYPYVLPTKNTARVIIDVGNYKYVYKYPSLFSNTVHQVAKGDVVKLLPFAYNRSDIEQGVRYEDIVGHKWVRVDHGGTEGYIPQAGLSWSLFSSDSAQPNTNAVIRDNAPLYVYNSATGDYEFLDGNSFLEKGKRVEVKTPFDSSSEYTQVIFSIETENGIEVIDIVCFVKTKFINYDGVDVLQIVSIIAIIIAVVLLIFLIIWMIRKRRNRKYND